MRRYVGAEIVEAPPEVLDEGMAGDDDLGGVISLQPAHGAQSCFEAAVVGLEGVVRVGLGAMEGRWDQLIDEAG